MLPLDSELRVIVAARASQNSASDLSVKCAMCITSNRRSARQQPSSAALSPAHGATAFQMHSTHTGTECIELVKPCDSDDAIQSPAL